MPKYLTGRVKRTPQGALSTDRYRYLGLDEAEPNLGDPPESDAIPAGTKFQIVSLIDRPGERFWQEVGGGLVPGSITVRDEGLVIPRTDASPNLGISSITDINFVGAAVTVVGFIKVDGFAGTAVTVTISPPGEDHQILFNDEGEFGTSELFTFNNTVGVGSVGIGTTDPSQTLHINGNFRLEGTFFDEENSSGGTGDLLVKTVNGGLKYTSGNAIRSGAGGTITQVQFHDSTGLVGGADNFVFDFTNNRIGIGSTQPDRLLDVLGNSRFSGITTFTDDVNFLGVSYNLLWNHSEDRLEFLDNTKATFGDDADASIYHDDADFYIDNNKGNIFLRVKNTENALKAIPDGGVELYFNNEKQMETVGGGVTITGDFSVSGISTLEGEVGLGSHLKMQDDSEIKLGLNDDLLIVHKTNGDSLIRENGSGKFDIQGTNITFKNSSIADDKTYAEFFNGDAVKLYFDNSLKFQTTGLGVSVTGLTSTTDLEVRQNVTSDLIPSVSDQFDIGSDPNAGGRQWNKIYAGEFIGQINTILERLEVDDLKVNGISTFIGIATFGSGIHVQSGVSTFSDTVEFAGLTTVTSTEHAFHTKQLSASGVSTFFNTVNVKTAGGSVIQDASGTLDLRSNIINLKNNGNNATFAKFSNGGSAELYHNNVKTFETVALGATVTGTFFTDQLDVVGLSTFRDNVLIKENIKLQFADTDRRITAGGDDLDIKVSARHDLNLVACADAADTGKINIVNVGSGITVNPDSSVDVYHESSKKLSTTGVGITVFGNTETQTLNVSGISTLVGVTTQKSTLFANQLSTVGVATFFDKVILDDIDGTSIIEDKSGTLEIRSNLLKIKDQGDTNLYLQAFNNAQIELYYANAKKFETGHSGITVTGSLITSAGISTIGGDLIPSQDLQHDLGKINRRWETLFVKDINASGGTIIVDNYETGNLKVNGISTFVGIATFGDGIHVQSGISTFKDIIVDNLKVNGISTFIGIATFGGGIHVQSGVTTVGFLTAVNDIFVAGVVTATDFNSLSDRNFKTNIQVIDNPIEKIMKIDGVSFNWKASNKPSFGVIADNVQETLPDLVNDTDPKTVNYNGLIGLLIEVVKNQQEQINELRGLLDK